MKKQHTVVFLLIFIAAIFCGCQPKEPVTQKTFVLDTIATITIYDAEQMDKAKQIINDSFSLCKEYEAMLSRTIEGSDVYKVNHAKGAPVTVSNETAKLIETAITYSVLSKGCFDISIAPVSTLWDFHAENPVPPSEEEVNARLPLVGYQNIQIDGNTITMAQPDCAIDLGGIAKGYIADQLYDYLKEQGVKSAIIDLGGNIMTLGGKSDNEPFQIGIQDPFQNSSNIIGSVPAKDLSIVTSGIYERCFTYDDALYHHLLNPKTGYPSNSDLASVTILSPHSIDGDALSTACFVMGIEDATALINSLEDIEAIFITREGQFYFSNGINQTVPFKEVSQ